MSSSMSVSPFAEVYFGHGVNPLPFGSPDLMNWTSDPAIFSASCRGLVPPPVWLSMRSVLWNQKEMSTQWKAPMRPSNSGGCQVNQVTKTGAGCFTFAFASVTTPWRLLLTSEPISAGFLSG